MDASRDTMSRSLFREEVVRARRADWLGELHFDAPKFGWPFFSAGLAAVLCIIIALSAGHYTRRERVSGLLKARAGVLNVSAPRQGLVTRILVEEGQSVRQGQSLIQISGEVDSVALGNTHAQINQDLQYQRKKVEQDLEGQDAILATRQRELQHQLLLTDREVESISNQLRIQKQRVQALASLYEKWLTIKDSGVLSKLQILQSQDNLLQQRSLVQELERTRIAALQKRSELKEQLQRVPIEAASQKNQLSRQLADISREISENEAMRGFVLNAPRSGLVTTLLVHPGQQVETSQQLLTLIPESAELIAELWIPTRAIGFVEVGSSVTLRYEAFPYQKFGAHKGKVAEVSKSGLVPEDAPVSQKSAGLPETYYRVLVQLEEQEINIYGRPERLRPGMELEADIMVERRRLLEWVFEPLYRIAQQQSGSPVEGKGSNGT